MICDSDGVVHFVRDPYNYDRDAVSSLTGLKCTDVTRTQQHHKEECDINTIVRRFGVTGQLPIMAVAPIAGDFTDVEDYRTMLDRVRAAHENFMLLPSNIRDRFEQDPRKFVDFCVDPANLEAVRELNLAPRPAAPAIDKVTNDGKG